MYYSGENQFFVYISCIIIHKEAHQVLIGYREAMLKSQKIRKFLYRINFGLMDAGKDMLLSHTQNSKNFSYTDHCIVCFIQNKDVSHFKEISNTG